MAEDHQLAELGARRISADTDPDELVLPDDAARRLGWIAAWLSQPPFIFREWGLGRYVDGGFRALFRGASGTGKTIAAIALAKSAGRELYRVDLGAVLSKYVGETEKNLKRLFEIADAEGAILLFDEADALFGKRSEVMDAHDRHANVDVAYLLQRIEAFDGLAILTTNFGSNVNQQVIGRIDVLVDFPNPDEAARDQLWSQLLRSVKMAKSETVDAAALGREYELSGAEILRSVRMAALQAATADQPVGMEALRSAAAERVAMRQSAKG